MKEGPFKFTKNKRWPTDKEIKILEEEEAKNAEKYNYEPDPICDCGNVSYLCNCTILASSLGFYSDGSPYREEK